MKEKGIFESKYLNQEISGIHQLTRAVRNCLQILLPLAIILEILILNVVPPTHHKNKGLEHKTSDKITLNL